MNETESPREMTWRDKVRFIFKMHHIEFVKSLLRRRRDRWFDKEYGTDTWRLYKLPGSKLEKNQNWPYSLVSEPSLIEPFQKLMEDLIKSGIILPMGVFVDVGCGKGLILLLATKYGFKYIIGVEKSQELCKIARRNVEIFKDHLETSIQIDVVEADATTYIVPDEANVFYLINPFNGIILRHFMQNLSDSLHRNWRPVVIIYSVPEHRKIIEDTGIFEVIKTEFFDPTRSIVFRTRESKDRLVQKENTRK